MDRRKFIKSTGLLATAVGSGAILGCRDSSSEGGGLPNEWYGLTAPFSLPALPYAVEALEPHIDARTMTIHHSKHHNGYVNKLNKALDGHTLAEKSLGEILSSLSDSEVDIPVRNNGGGHFNHSLFWSILTDQPGTKPSVELQQAIDAQFGDTAQLLDAFSNEAGSVFGSGWAWIIVQQGGALKVTSTANQDNPLMTDLVDDPGIPILGIDVWEHAYYLHYQNRRADYIQHFAEIINWDKVSQLYSQAIG